MADELVPRDVGDFILRHIDSIAQLEALLLLRAHPEQAWDVATLARRLYATGAEVEQVLARLCADGLASANEGAYRYECRTVELQNSVDRLAGAYSRHLIAVTNMIHAKPRRIREFADAFKFRKDR
jgi:hypothetical protein